MDFAKISVGKGGEPDVEIMKPFRICHSAAEYYENLSLTCRDETNWQSSRPLRRRLAKLAEFLVEARSSRRLHAGALFQKAQLRNQFISA